MRMERINKVPCMGDDDEVWFMNEDDIGEGVYLPYATFVTAAARNITIRAAQKCQDVKREDGRGSFLYADTDSIHILGDPPDDLWVDQKELGAWKNEGRFEVAKYLRPKTYIHCHPDYSVYTKLQEHKDGRVEKIVEGIKCAGMPDAVKLAMAENPEPAYAWNHFRIGETFPGKKMQRRVKGGLIIEETTYELKESFMRRGTL